MAKAPRKRSTRAPSPADAQRTLTFKLPPEQAAAFKLPQADALKEFAKAERAQLDRAAKAHHKLDEARKAIDRGIAIRDGLIAPPWRKGASLATPPTAKPRNVAHKIWLAAQATHALAGEERAWVNQEILLRLVRERIGDKRVSARTLQRALAYLRKRKMIDR